MNHPVPLPERTMLAGRFEVGRVLGRGGFGITYLAHDALRGDDCALKELAPTGVERDEDGSLAMPALGHAVAQRLKHQFLQEARLLQRLGVRGVLPVRAAFTELGTAYYAAEYVPDAISLDRLLQREGRMDAHGVLDILLQLLETLEGIHTAGVLHRDVKPSNVLVRPSGEAILIDFGSARAWHADRALRHTVQYTPGYAPLEQLSDQAPRGPATDLYGLCATAYALLTGGAPTPAEERAAGSPLASVASLRPDVEPAVATAIDAGLALRFEERPQTVDEFRAMLSTHGGSSASIPEIDEAIGRLKKFRFGRRECPACGGVLEEPKPLRPKACPVCRSGAVHRRKLSNRLCPQCRVGVLQPVRNHRPLVYCPLCETGRLATRGLMGKRRSCSKCGSEFASEREGVRLAVCTLDPERAGEVRSWDEWREVSGRSSAGWRCDGCAAQFDDLADGTRRQIEPPAKRGQPTRLYPEEWALVAHGLDPASGNAECVGCGADYYVDDQGLTLIACHEDPFGVGRQIAGQWLTHEQARWRAVGKSSPARGLVCTTCRTEFDGDSESSLRLIASPNAVLRTGVGDVLSLGNWHRMAQRLPPIGGEAELEDRLGDALLEGYRSGAVPFETKRPEIWWRGPARWVDPEGRPGSGPVSAGEDGIQLGGLLRKRTVPWQHVEGWRFELDPVELAARLTHASASVELTAEDLWERRRRAGR